jgi:hypothetical protein
MIAAKRDIERQPDKAGDAYCWACGVALAADERDNDGLCDDCAAACENSLTALKAGR